MSNPWIEYQENFRANMPSGVTYDSTIARYFFNGKRFVHPWEVVWYRNYLSKFSPLFLPSINDAGCLVVEDVPTGFVDSSFNDAGCLVVESVR